MFRVEIATAFLCAKNLRPLSLIAFCGRSLSLSNVLMTEFHELFRFIFIRLKLYQIAGKFLNFTIRYIVHAQQFGLQASPLRSWFYGNTINIYQWKLMKICGMRFLRLWKIKCKTTTRRKPKKLLNDCANQIMMTCVQTAYRAMCGFLDISPDEFFEKHSICNATSNISKHCLKSLRNNFKDVSYGHIKKACYKF